MDILIIFVLFIIGLGQLILAIYLLGISARLKNLAFNFNRDPESLNILHRAYNQAKNIIANAELAGIKIHAQSKLETKKLNEELALEVEMASSKVEQVLYKSAQKANEQYEKNLEQRSANIEKEMTEALAADVAEMKKSLEDYKLAKMKSMDENFAEITQRALEIVLEKKLTMANQMDLINEALEQAKKEKLIV